ncbi:hypothetical protein BCV71DRAFT_230471 [Rhizopus microsporus]|uniref:Uncharacterized protein n=1 Tax=Rhizopus microsporus TaxID=58291 RepID=A0A1X0SGI3_RHIZD|nr:hypothetical protein BCV71DRAFT_230471 [Rhizopus microsporus]
MTVIACRCYAFGGFIGKLFSKVIFFFFHGKTVARARLLLRCTHRENMFSSWSAIRYNVKTGKSQEGHTPVKGGQFRHRRTRKMISKHGDPFKLTEETDMALWD